VIISVEFSQNNGIGNPLTGLSALASRITIIKIKKLNPKRRKNTHEKIVYFFSCDGDYPGIGSFTR
jgi:hypothetical protein